MSKIKALVVMSISFIISLEYTLNIQIHKNRKKYKVRERKREGGERGGERKQRTSRGDVCARAPPGIIVRGPSLAN